MTPERYLETQTVTLEKETTNPETGEISIETFSKTATVAELSLNSSIAMNNLYVSSVYTTPSSGAMTLTCTCDGKTITVRTEVLKDANGQILTAEYFEGKTINVKGIIDYFSGKCQIKVFALYQITIKE